MSNISGIINEARSLFNDVAQPIGDIVDNYNKATTQSLTQRAKQCFIESRAYVDADIQHESVTGSILKFALTMQTSLVLCAIQLDGLVENGITVSDKLRTVASGNESYIDTAMLLRNDSIALEDIKIRIPGTNKEYSIPDLPEKYGNHAEQTIKKMEARLEEMRKKLEEDEREFEARYPDKQSKEYRIGRAAIDKARAAIDQEREKAYADQARQAAIDSKDITPDADKASVPVGKVIEVTLSAHNGNRITLPIFVRINPYHVKPELISYMMETCSPSVINGKRLAQLKAGEISFWKDFVFGMDIIERERKIRAKDKDGQFSEYLSLINAKDRAKVWQTFSRMAKGAGYRSSSNLANAVLVFSEGAVEDGRRRGGIDLSDYLERQKFFDLSYASMIFVVDPNHEKVTMYLNGFKDVGHYSYSDFVKKKDLEGLDFMSVMRSVAQGSISRF